MEEEGGGCVPFGRREALDARHHGRHVPEGQFRVLRRFWQWHVQGHGLRFTVVGRPGMLGIMAGTYQKLALCFFPWKDWRVFKIVNIPVVAQRLFPWS